MIRLSHAAIAGCVACSSFATSASAAGEAMLSHGRAQFFGDLSDEKSAPLTGLHLKYSDSSEPLRLGVSWDIMTTKVEHDHAKFPFAPDADLRILVFLFSPSVCWWQNDTLLSFCGAVGLGTVNVNSRDNRQDYGSWSYQLDLKYGDKTAVGIMTKYIGRVEQEVAGEPSAFAFASLGLSLTRRLGE